MIQRRVDIVMPYREKVIKGLECHQEPYGCPKCPYWDRETPLKDCENNKLIADVLALLREQEPVKPKRVSTIADTFIYLVCGSCEMPIGLTDRYCSQCGRKVKRDD